MKKWLKESRRKMENKEEVEEGKKNKNREKDRSGERQE